MPCQDPQHCDKTLITSPNLSQSDYLQAECLDSPLIDLSHTSLATKLLDGSLRPESEDERREFKADNDSRVARVRQRHAASGLHLALLQTCHLIHDETWKRPYLNYMFDVTNPQAEYLASKVLLPHQVGMIQSSVLTTTILSHRLHSPYPGIFRT